MLVRSTSGDGARRGGSRHLVPIGVIVCALFACACGSDGGDPTATGASGDPAEVSSTTAGAAAPAGSSSCPSGDPPPDLGTAPTVEDLYAAASEAYVCDGMVLHVVETGGSGPGAISSEMWVDVGRDVARQDASVDPGMEVGYARRIVLDGMVYETGLESLDGQFVTIDATPGVEARRCHDASGTVSLLLPCRSDEGVEDRTVTLVATNRDGRDLIDLVMTATVSGTNEGGSTTISTVTRSLDAATLLPVSHSETGEIELHGDGAVEAIDDHSEITAEFVPAESLPAWFFDTDTLAWPSDGPAGILTATAESAAPTAIHWLGDRFEPGGDLPSVEIGGVYPAIPGQDVGTIIYRTTDLGPVLSLQQMAADAWGPEEAERSRGTVCDGPWDLANGGEYTFYCSGGPMFADAPTPEEGFGIVAFPDATVLVGLTFNGMPSGPEQVPFASLDAVTAVAEGLRPY